MRQSGCTSGDFWIRESSIYLPTYLSSKTTTLPLPSAASTTNTASKTLSVDVLSVAGSVASGSNHSSTTGSGGGGGHVTLTVLIPKETDGSVRARVLPAKPAMTAREAKRMVAHREKVTNPQDYGFYVLVDGKGMGKISFGTVK